MILNGTRVLAWALLLALGGALNAQDAKQFVKQAVQTELAADANDHSHWLYYDTDRKPAHTVKQWVAETPKGDLHRVIEENGRPLSKQEQRSRMDTFIHDSSAQAKQQKAGQQDDKQAEQMLRLLPTAFIWTYAGAKDNLILMHFKPDPNFHPPTYESRVFAAMEGDMAVDKTQHRIVSLKGRMIREVKFGYGLFGELDAGGTFNVERRQTGHNIWQIVETHIHIHGHALIFKNISDQEDEEKTKLKQLPGNLSLQSAESDLLAQGQ